MPKLYVKIEGCVEVTREHDPEDRWSGEDTSTSWHIGDIALPAPASKWDYRSVEINYEPTSNVVFLVYAIYSTGDSFSHHSSGELELVDIYNTLDEAKACVAKLEKLTKKYDGDRKILTSSGKELDYCAPWLGYFEHLEELEVKPLIYGK